MPSATQHLATPLRALTICAITAFVSGCGSSDSGTVVFEEVTIDLTIEGERGTFTGLTKCRHVPQGILNIDEAADRWEQTGGAVVGSFPSGRGFVLVLGEKGEICSLDRLPKNIHPYKHNEGEAQLRDPASNSFQQLSLSSLRWGLFVFDTIDAPQEGRFYVGPDYFYQDGRSLEVHSITTRGSTRQDLSEWKSRWDDSGGNLGWLERVAEGNNKILFAGMFIQFSELKAKRLEHHRESIAVGVEKSDPSSLWIEITTDWTNFLLAKEDPAFSTTQVPGRIIVDRRAVAPLWWTTVYLNPEMIKFNYCSGVRQGSSVEQGLRLILDGNDTGASMRQNLVWSQKPGTLPDQVNTYPFNTDLSVQVAGAGLTSCLDLSLFKPSD